MKYKLITDSAIKMLIFIAKRAPEITTTHEISEHIGVGDFTTQNIIRKLKRNTKWIRITKGVEGGCYFVGDIERITVHDIHCAIEDEIRLSEAVGESDGVLRDMYMEFLGNAQAYFSSITLKDLIEKQDDKGRIIAWPCKKQQEPLVQEKTMDLQRMFSDMTAAYEGEIRRLKAERDSAKTAYMDMYKKIGSIVENVPPH